MLLDIALVDKSNKALRIIGRRKFKLSRKTTWQEKSTGYQYVSAQIAFSSTTKKNCSTQNAGSVRRQSRKTTDPGSPTVQEATTTVHPAEEQEGTTRKKQGKSLNFALWKGRPALCSAALCVLGRLVVSLIIAIAKADHVSYTGDSLLDGPTVHAYDWRCCAWRREVREVVGMGPCLRYADILLFLLQSILTMGKWGTSLFCFVAVVSIVIFIALNSLIL